MGAIARPTRQPVRMRGRSYVAFVFCPVVPIARLARGNRRNAQPVRPVFSSASRWCSICPRWISAQSAIAHLVASLEQRNIRILGIEGVDAARLTPSMPPLLTGGRHCVLALNQAEEEPETKPKPASLLLDSPVRSGQSIVFHRWRRDGAGLGRFRRGNRRRRLHPYLRNASRPRDGGHQRQLGRADLLPENRGGAFGHRRILSNR